MRCNMPRVHKCSSKDVVNQILNKPLEWTEWRALPEEARKQWGNDALSLLNNRVFQSIFGKSEVLGGANTSGEYVKMCIENIARASSSQIETEQIRSLICGIERIREMIEEMIIVEDKIPVTDPFAAI